MKYKRLLKFYFYADSLNRALDNLITKSALSSMDCYKSGDCCFDEICEIIEKKKRLGELWRYMDGVMKGFSESEKNVLRFYGAMKCGIARLSAENRKEIKRLTVRFARRAHYINRFWEGARLVGEYYCLIN